MDSIIRRDITKVIKQVLSIIEKDELYNLKGLSNHTIHNASIYQDEYSISIAVIISAITKLSKRLGYVDNEIISELEKAITLLNEKRDEEFHKLIIKIMEIIRKQDSKVRLYIQEVLDKAKIKKGTRIYEHGISMARAAELIGISQWELMQYIGNTEIQEDYINPTHKKKIRFLRKLFRLK